ncbi:MAG: glycosyltransferase family 4 protein [Hormoscilla sp. GUM202]|nr:glycosyltransferase family 4 protein [Hormoscilla sp. GUM202]
MMTKNQETIAGLGVRSILHINEKGGKFGGTEEYIISLAQLLMPMGTTSHLLYDGVHGTMPTVPEKSEISHTFIPGLGNRDGDAEVPDRVLDAVREINPDLVYVHNIFDGRVIQALNQPDRKYLILWYIHDHFPTCLTELRARRNQADIVCYQPLSQACLDNIAAGDCVKRHAQRNFADGDLKARISLLKSLGGVDAIVVVSEFMKEILIANLPDISEKTYVLPRQVRPSNKRIQRSTAAVPAIAWAGRITWEKGLHLAIEALCYLQVKEKIVFKIAGVVENESYWSDCLKLVYQVESKNPWRSIQYLGHLSYEEVDRLYGEADIVVVPSIWGEPLGAVAAEALRNGAAVVASAVGGIDTWVIPGKTGILVKPNDAAALSEAIALLLDDRELRSNLANAGRELINSKFTGEEHLKALAEVIQNCR